MASPKTAIKVVLGAMTFGRPNTLGARLYTAEDAGKVVDSFIQHGHDEIDTARVYGNGTTEEILAELGWQERGIVMDTKLYPKQGTALSKDDPYTHKPEDVRRGLLNSLKALNTDKVDMFYLHGPDRRNSFEDTLHEVNNLYKEGCFNRFGISNYMSWEVARICEICERNGWIKPTVYQGIYHALQRRVDEELIPCLRYYNIALYAFQPLAGGFLTGRYTRDQEIFEEGSRFDPNIMQGSLHRGRYWNDKYFDALDLVKKAVDKEGLTVAEAALRWLEYHSSLSKEKGDAIIVGASSVKHLEENLSDLEKGPLPQAVIAALDEAWLIAKPVTPNLGKAIANAANHGNF